MTKILLVEDEALIRSQLVKFLENKDYQVDGVESVEQVQQQCSINDYDLILTDIRLPGVDGTTLLKYSGDIPVIVMTSFASVDSAVNAMKLGAADYIAKPFDHYVLLELLEKVLRATRQHKEIKISDPLLNTSQQSDTSLVGNCPAMLDLFSRIEKVSSTVATVLILGDSGTGKELVAREIHRLSARSDEKLCVFNCAAVPDHQIETELFGSGNSTGLVAEAQGGTLFLDEIGELPHTAQARLLRLLQMKEQSIDNHSNDIRLIASTHRDIRQLVQDRSFRSDLYFRLRVVELTLPPLRERGDDIRDLAIYLFDTHCRRLQKTNLRIHKETLKAIRRYQWPGNVRELSNALERAVILCDGEVVMPSLLSIDHHLEKEGQAVSSMQGELSLEEYFRCFVLEHQKHMTEIELASKLGISRKTLWQRRQKFGIPRQQG